MTMAKPFSIPKREVWKEGDEIKVQSGTAVYVPSDEKHCFKNTGTEKLMFLCLIPISK